MPYIFPYISTDNKIFLEEQSSVPVITNGLLSGEGIFTTLKVKNFLPLFFEKHQKRLQTHMAQLGFQPFPPNFSLYHTLLKLIQKNNLPDCAVRITILNRMKQSLSIINARDLPPTGNSVNALTVEDTRDSVKTIKTINRLENRKAEKYAAEHNADTALFVQNGNIIESTNANIFSLDEHNNLITPNVEEKGLKGIMREVLMEQTNVLEKNISKETPGPLVLTNSLRLQKIEYLDNRKLSNPEQLFQKLKALREKAEEHYIKDNSLSLEERE